MSAKNMGAGFGGEGLIVDGEADGAEVIFEDVPFHSKNINIGGDLNLK